MKKYLFLVCFLFPFLLSAQYYWDYGGGIGGANYLGEIGGYDQDRRGFVSDMRITQTRWAANGFARRKIIEGLSASAGIYYGRIQCADSLSIIPTRNARNLSFRNDIIEVSARGEYTFYSSYDVGSRGRYILDFKTFIFAGVGGFFNNPKAKTDDGEWVALQPLHTEGPANKYSRIQLCFPLGMGFYYTYKKKHRIGWEMGWRWTLTDYIDDISTVYTRDTAEMSDLAKSLANRNKGQNPDLDLNFGPANKYQVNDNPRGDPKKNDSYVFTNFTYSYVIKGKYRNRKFRPSKLGIGGLGDVKRRKKRKTRAKF